MKELRKIFENNKMWAQERLEHDPAYFSKMTKAQRPGYLWIGCADSRVPANEIMGLEPGEVFVHRNVANLCPHTDFNCLSVLEYAVDLLKIEHIIVCGHYGCGGIEAAMQEHHLGLVDNWLRHIRDVYAKNRVELEAIADPQQRQQRLTELNVVQQVLNVCHTTIVQGAWQRGQLVFVHGWIYDMQTGELKDLDCCVSSHKQVESIYRVRL